MKHVKKLVITGLALVSAATLFSCNENSGNLTDSTLQEVDTVTSDSLRIFKSDLKLSHETREAQMKKEYLLSNNGYKDSDVVSAIVTLNQKSILDSYNDDYQAFYENIEDFMDSNIAKDKKYEIKNEQNHVITTLKRAGYFKEVEHTYSTILNGFSAKMTYENFKKLETSPYVSNIILGDTYNKVKTTSSDSTGVTTNVVDVYETGIFNSSSVASLGINGDGTAVAVLDSGFDCSHIVFNNPLNDEMIKNEVVTLDTISANLEDLNAYSTTKDLKAEDLWYSKKIPYAYDYADKDFDVNPFDSEHGTHVAGIIGGNGEDKKVIGVAPYTQLVLMKVFSDTSGGAETEDLLAALEDSVVLGVDAINMSLGTTCGFNREADNDAINEVYDGIQTAGISLVAAASNDYSAGMGGPDGNTNKVTNPDSGTLGSPSSYTSTLSVASISGVKSSYIVANNKTTFFFTESNNLASKPENFVSDLAKIDADLDRDGTKTYEYVVVPGTGIEASYSSVNVKGKIAIIKRGTNTFDEKVRIAKKKGAIAAIIYNNVEGDIAMSLSEKGHIPAISVRKDVGEALASTKKGTLTISKDNLAGPFMSDFSSWGPTPSLDLKPEITAHGGEILSSIPGGEYDRMSGTSMATPNMSGIIVLIRQYVKNNYPDLTYPEIQKMTYSLLMSTATIALNEEGNPYTPRKQGAGLASLNNIVSTGAYITVNDKEKAKLELGDDPKRTGVYEMTFTLNNISTINNNARDISYRIDLDALTETVSSSNKNFVAEKSHMLTTDNKFTVTVDGRVIDNNIVTVKNGESVNVTITYRMTEEDKKYITDSFPFGMYVEGFVKAVALDEAETSLNVPFLAFFGDWTEAPIFDKTYFEVEKEAHNNTLDEESKIKADYYATRPFGSYMYNYIIPLGTYIYSVPEGYEAIPGSEDHIAVSSGYGTIDGISVVYAGALRCSKTMTYTITDNVTGEVIYEYVDYNAKKAYGYGGSATPYYDYIRQSSLDLGLVNNRSYSFNMVGTIDYGDGGLDTNARNSFGFDFTMDDEAPIIKNATFEKVYDKTKKKDRYYVNLTVYDNHYVQSITPLTFTSSSSYTTLADDPIPVYSEKGTDSKVKIEITDYMDSLYTDALVNNAITFNIDDYALNTNVFVVELPSTTDGFKFTSDGNDGDEIVKIKNYVGETIDLTKNMYVKNNGDKDYLKFLTWTSDDESIAEVRNGIVYGKKVGQATITALDRVKGSTASITVDVKARKKSVNDETNTRTSLMAYDGPDKISKIYFDYFDTVLAYSLADQTSKIGATGDRIYLSATPGYVSFYPGEKIKLHANVTPYYVFDKYDFKYESYNPKIATVSEDGVVTALKEGTTTISLTSEKTNLEATVTIVVNNEFVIEGRTLVAYKGLGGDVVIPADKGIMYIGSYAFSLYDTDRTVQNPDDDNDYNKTPNKNTSIKSVTIPEGVEDIQKYAFYNCAALETVVLPKSIRFVREFAFSTGSKNEVIESKLKTINLEDVEVLGKKAFANCKELTNVDLSSCYAMGDSVFEGCSSLTEVNISKLRNTGSNVFANCENLSLVYIDNTGLTKLGVGMFKNTNLERITTEGNTDTNSVIKVTQIPKEAFYNTLLTDVTIEGKVITIGQRAFANNKNLTNVNITATVEYINDYAFASNTKLESVTLPNSAIKISNDIFNASTALTTLKLQANTYFTTLGRSFLNGTNVASFVVDSENQNYASKGSLLLNKNLDTIILAAPAFEYGEYTVSDEITAISDSAFAGVKTLTALTLHSNLEIGEAAFADCTELTTVVLPEGFEVSDYAFYKNTKLQNVNIENASAIGSYAFYQIKANNIVIGDDVTVGEKAFSYASIYTVTLGNNVVLQNNALANISTLQAVIMPSEATVTVGNYAFYNDNSLNVIDLSKVTGEIGAYAFAGCSGVTTADLQNVTLIGDYAFNSCNKLKTLNVPKVTSIGAYAFSKSSDSAVAPIITELTLPETLTELGEGAFRSANSLTRVTINGVIEEIKPFTFYGTTSLSVVTLPSTVKTIGEQAFAACKALSKINLENVTEIASGAFVSCGSLKNVDLTNAIVVGEGAFANCAIENAIVANSLKEVYDYAFQANPIPSFTASNLEYIGEGAFSNTKLTSFTISNKLSYFADLVFYKSSLLADINYDNNGTLSNNGVVNKYAELVDGVLYTRINEKKQKLSTVPENKNVTTLVVKEGTSMIGIFAGASNKYLENIVLPDSLKTVGAFAFYKSNKLKSVEFKSVNAPQFEAYQIEELVRETTDPGYQIIHRYYSAYGSDIYYANFINLIGKNEPIKLIVPKNEKLNGYDSIFFEVYFGGIENATKSDYMAMGANGVLFVESMERIMKLDRIALQHESIINNASKAYSNLDCDLTEYGFTKAEIDLMATRLQQAKDELKQAKYISSSTSVKDMQKVIDNLDTVFTINRLPELEALAKKLDSMKVSDKDILDLSNYDKLMASYNSYLASLKPAIDNSNNVMNGSYNLPLATLATVSLLAFAAYTLIKKHY